MFGAEFNEKQIDALILLFNDEHVFLPSMDKNKIIALFSCKHRAPFLVKDVRKMCYIMDALREQNLITPEWQAVSDKYQCFLSVRGKLMTRNMLSSAKYRAMNDSVSLLYQKYNRYIDALKNLK